MLVRDPLVQFFGYDDQIGRIISSIFGERDNMMHLIPVRDFIKAVFRQKRVNHTLASCYVRDMYRVVHFSQFTNVWYCVFCRNALNDSGNRIRIDIGNKAMTCVNGNVIRLGIQ